MAATKKKMQLKQKQSWYITEMKPESLHRHKFPIANSEPAQTTLI